MIEDAFHDHPWPVVTAFVMFSLTVMVVACAIAATSISSDRNSRDERLRTAIACIAAGGQLGQSEGWPTCVHGRTS